ncbi:MAG: hypothetical protein ABJC26_06865 [Gemmatimonadaceae bacterium]
MTACNVQESGVGPSGELHVTTISLGVPLNNGSVGAFSRQVTAVDASSAAQVATMVLSDTAVRLTRRALTANEAPAGTTERIIKSEGGQLLTATATRDVAGAPVSHVIVRDGNKVMFAVSSTWEQRGEIFALTSRTYEHAVADGKMVSTTIRYNARAAQFDSVWSGGLRGASVSSSHFSVPPAALVGRLQSMVMFDDEESGCFLKGVQLAASSVAAGLAFTGVVAGGLLTIVSGGTATPAELAAIGIWVAAEGLYANRLDAWLDCAYPQVPQ